MVVYILETNQESGEGFVEIFVAHEFVVPWGMMFGKVLRHVGSAFAP